MKYTVYGLWEGFDSDSSMFNRNVKTLAQFAGQEYQLLYETSVDPETGRIYYAASEPKTMTRALSVNEVMLPVGTYEMVSVGFCGSFNYTGSLSCIPIFSIDKCA